MKAINLYAPSRAYTIDFYRDTLPLADTKYQVNLIRKGIKLLQQSGKDE